MEWEPGSGPVNSAVPPPRNRAQPTSAFNRSEFEVFAHHTASAAHSGDSNGDRLLEWATNPKFKAQRVRYVRMRTMGKHAVKLNMPGGVLQKDFSEPADGAQRMIFFYRSLYDAVKQLLRSARLAGRQYTGFERVYSVGHKRKYGAINRGEMYEISQGYAGRDVSPLPVFLSSDATVICKKMGAHPIISESTDMCLQHMHAHNDKIQAYTYMIHADTYRYIRIPTQSLQKMSKYEA
jgi:hypothetical protein